MFFSVGGIGINERVIIAPPPCSPGLENLDVFDGRSDCELMAAESSTEDLVSVDACLRSNRPGYTTRPTSSFRFLLAGKIHDSEEYQELR